MRASMFAARAVFAASEWLLLTSCHQIAAAIAVLAFDKWFMIQKLLDAAKDGDLEMVEEALGEGANVDVSVNGSVSTHIHSCDMCLVLCSWEMQH